MSELTEAIGEDDYQGASKLIEENRDDTINEPDEDGCYPIHLVTDLSLYDGIDESTVQKLDKLAVQLLEKGVNTEVLFEGAYPIHYVVAGAKKYGEQRTLALLKKFIEHGADYNKQDLSGETILHRAIALGLRGILEYILNLPKVDLTLKTDPEVPDIGGFSPIDYAHKYFPECVDMLENYAQRRDIHNTPITWQFNPKDKGNESGGDNKNGMDPSCSKQQHRCAI